MAKLKDLLVVIGLSKAGMIKLNADLRRTKANFKRNFGEIQALTSNLGRSLTLGLSAPLAGIGAAAVKSAIDLEKLETSFISLTGGAEQAANMMANLNDFTAKTPFQIEGVANAARQLIASGSGIDEVNDQLQFLGDIAATSGSEIQDIAAIFAKVNAKGKVELENLNQLAERGIPIFEALADATGLPANKLGAGAVPVKQFNEVLAGFAKQGGFAAGAMERLSETAAGKLSTAVDNLKLAGAELAQTLLPTIKEIISSVTRAAQRFTALNRVQQDTLLILGAITASGGPLLMMIGGFADLVPILITAGKAFAGVAIAIGPVSIAVGAMIGTLALLAHAIKNKHVKRLNELEDAARRSDDAYRRLNKTLAGEIANTSTADLQQQLADLNKELERNENVSKVAAEGADLYAKLNADNADEINRATLATAKQNKGSQEQIKLARELRILQQKRLAIQRELERRSRAGDSGGSESQSAFEQTRKEKERLADLTRQVIVTAKDEQEALEGVTRHYRELTGVLEEIEIDPEESITEFDESFFKLGERLARTRERAIEAAASIKQAFTDTANSIAVSVGVGIGQALAGADNAFRSMGNTVLMTLASLAVQVGQMAIGIGLAVKGIKKALLSLSPIAAIAAGIALVALGSAAKAAIQNSIDARAEAVPQMAEGGLFTGASLAMVGEGPGTSSINPEVVAPLDKLRNMIGGGNVNVTGTIRGRDLLLSEERSAYSRRRRFGN